MVVAVVLVVVAVVLVLVCVCTHVTTCLLHYCSVSAPCSGNVFHLPSAEYLKITAPGCRAMRSQ